MNRMKNKFRVGDMVIVNCGMVDPDFGQEISGWIGTIENCHFIEGKGYIYKLRWSDETLRANSVLRVSCQELGLEFETMQLLENELSLHSSARSKHFVQQCLALPRRERAYCYADFSLC
ncbi:hypothetical protein [Photobacterium rosenbergii]|uniref:DUF2158 domain-containing protein n=1 Tax=Photobacterium rosenbergii TaxID=294936 RepID=A0ABU3ZJS2_9GAMM|nr:hypothetical protein [Photobacterium rosenbergii]MDV5170358.1 hypothetical protein [Photobacterium rosenbergii]